MRELKYMLQRYRWLKILFSPFKPFKIKWYAGKTVVGVPYFLPRKAVKSRTKPGYLEFVPLKFGFSSCSLGWKTKWRDDDYRFEHSPKLSFVCFGYQIAVSFSHEHPDQYWTAWLYYEYETKGTRRERVEQCRKKFPQKWKVYKKGEEEKVIDYYKLILKKKYLN